MVDVSVAINGAILYCDDSILGLHIGRDYTIVKTYIDDLPFKDKITDGGGKINISYFGSVLKDGKGKYLMCLEKNDVHQIENPLKGRGVYTNKDLRCSDQIEAYNHCETDYLHMVFSLLRLFKAGNIGTKEIFLHHSYSLGIIKSNLNHVSDIVTRNITDSRMFSLSETELQACNQFLADYCGTAYMLIKDNINEFIWGQAQVDRATGFEQFTTALEMTLLTPGQQGKKEVLSKRVAVLLESTSTDMAALYIKMKEFYRYRSESLHEGDNQNITNTELIEMEGIVRRVLCKCLERCKAELTQNASITWDQIKTQLITDLMTKVAAENAAGTF